LELARGHRERVVLGRRLDLLRQRERRQRARATGAVGTLRLRARRGRLLRRRVVERGRLGLARPGERRDERGRARPPQARDPARVAGADDQRPEALLVGEIEAPLDVAVGLGGEGDGKLALLRARDDLEVLVARRARREVAAPLARAELGRLSRVGEELTEV